MDQITHDIRLRNWTSLLQNCAESGLSKQEWCRQNGIKAKNFYYWQRKVRHQTAALQTVSNTPPAAFAEVKVTSSEGSSERNFFHPDIVIRDRTLTIEISNTASDRLLSLLGEVMRHAE